MSRCLCEMIGVSQTTAVGFWVGHSIKENDLRYLGDEHPRGHGETGSRGEMACDHDPHPSLREGQLVGVGAQQLVHHQHRWFSVVVPWWTHQPNHLNLFIFPGLCNSTRKKKAQRLKSHLSSATQR